MPADPAPRLALDAVAIEPRPSAYPEPFRSRLGGRIRRALGDSFGLTQFGVNLTCLQPGARSSMHHRHSRQEEMIYVLDGEPTLVTEDGDTQLRPGMVAGFAAGGSAHHVENRSDRDCLILEIGDRSGGDEVSYPEDDFRAVAGPDGKFRFTRKDGTPY